jgi:hypothetical protein
MKRAKSKARARDFELGARREGPEFRTVGFGFSVDWLVRQSGGLLASVLLFHGMGQAPP